ncbi:MAG: hypothetical protein ACFE0J_24755 [Elainellaceae cyanobacterium]
MIGKSLTHQPPVVRAWQCLSEAMPIGLLPLRKSFVDEQCRIQQRRIVIVRHRIVAVTEGLSLLNIGL